MAEPARNLDPQTVPQTETPEAARRYPVAAPAPTPSDQKMVNVDRDTQPKTSYQAYQILHVGFTVAPIVAGADKFVHLLANWDAYLAPIVPRVTGISAHTFMLIVGGIEIVAGLGVAVKPKIFGYVVSAWLLGIVCNLLVRGAYFDIALRDFGLCLGALALGRLSQFYDNQRTAR